MGTITAQQIIDKAGELLLDEDAVRWPDEEKLKWLNDGLRVVAVKRPDQSSVRDVLPLVVGTLQSFPGLVLLDVTRNMGVGGAFPGAAIRKADIKALDAMFPNWHASTLDTVVRDYFYDPVRPHEFHVYPPSDGGGTIECIYIELPTELGYTDVIPYDDTLETALLNYVLFRAFSKDMEEGANATAASAYYKLFETHVGAA